VREGEQTELQLAGFVLAGDTSAQAWITTLLKDQLPAQAYGRLLLSPGAKPPLAVQSRGTLVCTCFNITDAAIERQLQAINQGAGAVGQLATDKGRLAALQDALQCGTNCGSCVPELQRMVRSSRAKVPTGEQALERAVIPVHLAD
jgi:assimilatory nitrate reductase catalytic subunit